MKKSLIAFLAKAQSKAPFEAMVFIAMWLPKNSVFLSNHRKTLNVKGFYKITRTFLGFIFFCSNLFSFCINYT
jgi:hypothetical protein